MEIDNNINGLINSYLDDTFDEAGLKTLLEWLQADPQHADYFSQVVAVWEQAGKLNQKNPDIDQVLQKLNLRIKESTDKNSIAGISKNNITKRLPFYSRIAAIVLLLTGISVVFYLTLFNSSRKVSPVLQDEYFTVVAPMNQKSRVILTDGTGVWLNCGTTLKYKANYGAVTRDVYLEGEAYFEVAKDPKKPFLVHASSLLVKAIGTSFNVKCYPEDETIETTLVEGKVEVSGNNKALLRKDRIVLLPNEKATFNKTDSRFSVSQLFAGEKEVEAETGNMKQLRPKTIEAVISWKDQQLVFENEPFYELTRRLERWYNVSIEITDSNLLHANSYTGKFENNESLDQVLKIISRTTPIQYKLDSRKVIISSE